MVMQVTWLKDFLELARTRSFTKAAENRNVTHPAFGRRIKGLEEWAGVALVERSKPVELTPDGVVVLEAATEIIETLRILHERLSAGATHHQTDLRIATGVAISATFFPLWYKKISENIGPFHTSVMTGNNDKAMEALASQEADVLLAYSSYHTRLHLSPAQFEWMTIGQEKLVPVSIGDADGKPVFTGMKVKPDPVLTFAPATALSPIMTRHIGELTDKPNMYSIHETDSYSSILELAAIGIGMAWLPLGLVQSALDAGRVVLIDRDDWFIPVDIAIYRRKFFSHAIMDRLWAYYLGDTTKQAQICAK